MLQLGLKKCLSLKKKVLILFCVHDYKAQKDAKVHVDVFLCEGGKMKLPQINNGYLDSFVSIATPGGLSAKEAAHCHLCCAAHWNIDL